ERARRSPGDQALEALPARRLEEEAREREVVLDDEEHRVARPDGRPVVPRLVGGLGRLGLLVERCRQRRRLARRAGPGCRRRLQRGKRHGKREPAGAGAALNVGRRQVERERAALPRGARQADLAAEELGELAADREAEARAAVLARGRAVGLLERLEDDLLLVGRDA